MKKLTLATLSTLALTLSCTQVFAVDGTITVNGVITDGTCTLNGDGGFAMGLKDISLDVGTIPKSKFTPTLPDPRKYGFTLYLSNAAGTGVCDAVTSKAFKGIHLSVTSPTTDLDDTDKTLLVNKASGASSKNPIFIQIHTEGNEIVDFSAPWGVQAKSAIYTLRDETYLQYDVVPASKTGIVDAQNYAAKINYTMHYN